LAFNGVGNFPGANLNEGDTHMGKKSRRDHLKNRPELDLELAAMSQHDMIREEVRFVPTPKTEEKVRVPKSEFKPLQSAIFHMNGWRAGYEDLKTAIGFFNEHFPEDESAKKIVSMLETAVTAVKDGVDKDFALGHQTASDMVDSVCEIISKDPRFQRQKIACYAGKGGIKPGMEGYQPIYRWMWGLDPSGNASGVFPWYVRLHAKVAKDIRTALKVEREAAAAQVFEPMGMVAKTRVG
jgi:hypothetical protein